MELKTIKDILENYPEIEVEETEQIGFIEKINTEMIKWIKEIEKEEGSILIENNLTTTQPKINLDDGNMIIRNIIYNREDRNKIALFLRFLFEITEEDLK